MDFITLLLASASLTQILMYSYIFNIPRRFLIKSSWIKELLSCSLCTGFWASLFFTIILSFINPLNFFQLITYPFAGSSISFIFDHIMGILLQYSNDENEQNITQNE